MALTFSLTPICLDAINSESSVTLAGGLQVRDRVAKEHANRTFNLPLGFGLGFCPFEKLLPTPQPSRDWGSARGKWISRGPLEFITL
jgi:hypothetical protein